jgi:hypothetical protein
MPRPKETSLKEMRAWLAEKGYGHPIPATRDVAWGRVISIINTLRSENAMRLFRELMLDETRGHDVASFVEAVLDDKAVEYRAKAFAPFLNVADEKLLADIIAGGLEDSHHLTRYEMASILLSPAKSCKVREAMIAKVNWLPFYKILRKHRYIGGHQPFNPQSISGAQTLALLLGRPDLDPADDDARVRFVHDSVEGGLFFGDLCPRFFSARKRISNKLAELVCDNQVKAIEDFGKALGGRRYPDGCASRFHGVFDSICKLFEDENVASDVYNRVVDAMRKHHPEPRTVADKKILEPRMDNHRAIAMASVLMENRKLAEENAALKRDAKKTRFV